MFGTARPPSAQELQQLVDLTSRDPGSPAFVDLGEAFMALGRPQEAIEVGARGLRANPNSIEGRLMVSRAMVQLHQWKEAQVELLKVVKVDRNHAGGFLLLGEVLMRRADYERAMPVLQHAQNLDPGNARVADLLRRARSQLPLDPPPPIPTPRPLPQAAPPPPMNRPPMLPAGRMAMSEFGSENEPTRVPQPLTASPGAPTVGLQMPGLGMPGMQQGMPGMQQGRPPMPAAPMPGAGPGAPTQMQSSAGSGPYGQAGSGGYAQAGAPAEGGVRPRPRVLPAEKPKDAAQASLRQSAAAGENYLNNLLMAGLLDLPNVRAPEAEFEVSLGKRWGRSTRRAFIFLFVLLFAGFGGGGYWYYYAEKQRAMDVARHLAEARRLMESGAYTDLEGAVRETQDALKRDQKNVAAMAVYAKAASLLSLLYGVPADPVEIALATVRKSIEQGDEGWRDMTLARAASTLAVLPTLDEAKARLKDTRESLEAWLTTHPDDAWAHWLHGKALEAAGNYKAALEAYEKAEAGGQGPVVATISMADVLLDQGNARGAMERYERALERAPKHPLALMGRIFQRTETSADPAEISGEINVNFEGKEHGPRLHAYKVLAGALASYLIEDYVKFSEQMAKAQEETVREPRYLARVSYGRLLEGKIKEAGEVRAQVAWYGETNPEPPLPLITLLDAELLLVTGLPGETLKKLAGLDGIRAKRLRGRALYDQGKAREALDELGGVLESAPDDLEALTWSEAARLIGNDRKESREADVELDKLGRNSRNNMVRYVHGDALVRAGKKDEARSKLELSLKELSAESPNPLAYRAHVALAGLDLQENQAKSALEHLDKAAEQVSGYLPAQGILGRIQLSQGQAEDAMQTLKPVVEEPELATAQIELAYAEAIVSRKGAVSDEEREIARQAVRRAKEKGFAPAEELARVAALVDPALLEELGLGSGSKPAKKKRRR